MGPVNRKNIDDISGMRGIAVTNLAINSTVSKILVCALMDVKANSLIEEQAQVRVVRFWSRDADGERHGGSVDLLLWYRPTAARTPAHEWPERRTPLLFGDKRRVLLLLYEHLQFSSQFFRSLILQIVRRLTNLSSCLIVRCVLHCYKTRITHFASSHFESNLFVYLVHDMTRILLIPTENGESRVYMETTCSESTLKYVVKRNSFHCCLAATSALQNNKPIRRYCRC